MKLFRSHTCFAIACLTLSASVGCAQSTAVQSHPATVLTRNDKVVKTEAQWKSELSPLEYRVTRLKGTEAPGSGELLRVKREGVYSCKCCDLPLFDSSTKFDSGTGWPSFFKPIDSDAIMDIVDSSYGMTRTENVCSRCGAHLGHVFTDGPPPTGLRYCMNSVSLKFQPKSGSRSKDAAMTIKLSGSPAKADSTSSDQSESGSPKIDNVATEAQPAEAK
jgi:peptide-methionine (R)-S-oxide reductase